MSKKTDKLEAAAKLAAEKAAKEVQAAEDKLAAAKAAEADEALKSPADKALERAFSKGTLPESDRRAADHPPVDNDHIAPGSERFPDAHVADGVVVEATDPVVSPVAGVETVRIASAPTGVRSPGNIEINVTEVPARPGTTVPPLVDASLPIPPTARRETGPTIPESVETRGPLVPLNPVQPSTVEVAVRDQRIPNDQINAVFEDANGVKRDALGHVLVPGGPPKVAVKPTGQGFE